MVIGFKATVAYVPSAQFRHLTTTDGLPHSNISAIVQDKYGFIWIGTKNGLCRYDGYTIVTYRSESTGGMRISDNNIMAMCLDSSGYLWVGTWKGGLNRIDVVTETCTVFRHDSTNPNSIADNEIRCLYCSKDGTVWIGTWNGGLSALNSKNSTMTTYQRSNSKLPSNIIMAITEDTAGNIWVGTYESMYLSRLSPKTKQWSLYDIASNKYPKTKIGKEYGVYVLRCDESNTLWVSTTAQEFIRIQITPGNILQKNIRYQQARSSNADQRGWNIMDISCMKDNIWIGTASKGLSCYNKQTSKFIYYDNISSEPNSLVSNSIRYLFCDNRNILWIGTREEGISVLYPFYSRFNILLRHNLLFSSGYFFLMDKYNRLWLSASGVQTWNKKSDSILSVQGIANGEYGSAYIVQDSFGYIWVSTTKGLKVIHPKTNRVLPLRSFISGEYCTLLENEMDIRIFPARNGSLIIGSHRIGFYRYSTQEKSLNRLWGIEPRITTCLLETSEGQIILGNDLNGVIVYTIDSATQTYSQTQTFVPNAKDSNSISHEMVYCLAEGAVPGKLWIGTYNGLNSYDFHTGKWQHFYEKDGLPNSTVYGILHDSEDDLWVTTTVGLACVRHQYSSRSAIDKTIIIPFTHQHGLPKHEFLPFTHYQSGDGTIYIGTRNAIVTAYPPHIKQSVNTLPPPVYITQFRKFSNRLQSDSAMFVKKVVELEERDNVFSIDFVALNYFYTEANTYSYFLEGFDKEWSPLNKQRSATYTNLSAGTYIFRVKASNNDGFLNERGTALMIIIRPPWWKTVWAYSFYGCISIMLILSSIKYREKRQKVFLQQQFIIREGEIYREKNQELLTVNMELEYNNSQLAAANRQLEELNTERTEFMSVVAHDLKNPLIGIRHVCSLLLDNINSTVRDIHLQESLGVIARTTERMFALVQKLLVLSKNRI
jgi:ligand-binding sensor domain-containing protein